MTRLITILVLVFGMVAGINNAAGQTDNRIPIDLGDGYKIELPADWGITENANTGGASITDADFTVFIDVLTPPQVERLLGPEAAEGPAEALALLLEDIYNEIPASDSIETTTFAGYPAAQRRFTDSATGLDGESIVMDLGGGMYAFFDIFVPRSSPAGDYNSRRSELRALLATFGPISNLPGTAATAEAAVSESFADIEALAVTVLEPCLVTPEAADRAQVQVGPGMNRTVIDFLRMGVEYPAIGRYSAPDLDWYQLDRELVAPGSGAAQLWVQADEVTTTGDCDALIAVTPPPLIPHDASAATPVPEWPVQPGAWTLTLSASGRALCPDGATVTFATAPALPADPISGQLRVEDEGNTLIFSQEEGGTAFSRSGRNAYQGTITLAERSLPLRLTIEAADRIAGMLSLPALIEDAACRAEVPVTLTAE